LSKARPVYLLAGGRWGRDITPDPLIVAAIRECGKAAPTVSYVGAANGDDASFFHRMASAIKAAGASSVVNAPMSSKRADIGKAKDIIAASDMVYISGGDVEAGMQVLEEKNLVDFLRELHDGGKPFFGLSAGSIMLAKHWVRWPDPDDDDSAELFPCLNFAPVLCDTHGEADGWEELQAAVKLAGNGTTGYGIVSGTAIRVAPDGSVRAMGGEVHRYEYKGKAVVRIPAITPAGG
jgi:peptidase E